MAVPAAPTLTVDLDSAREAAKITVGVPATSTMAYVWRVSPSGSRAGVRGAYPATVTPGVLIVRDYEIPLNVQVEYFATAANSEGESAVTGPVVFQVGVDEDCDAWLVDTVRPENSAQYELVSLVELAYPIAAGVHRVLGRRDPVVTADVAGTPHFELVFLTKNDAEREQATLMVGNGVPMLLRTTQELGIGNFWLYALEWKTGRVVPLGTEDDRIFSLGCVQVERPNPNLYVPVAPVDYAEVMAAFATYAALEAGVESYDGVLYDYSLAGEAPTAPWPEVDA